MKECCKECGREIPQWLKINQIIAKGGKIIGVLKNEITYYEPINN